MVMYSKEDLIEFIRECTPKFEKVNNEYKMFTITTQWTSSSNIEELLQLGIDCYKKDGVISPLARWIDHINEKLEYKKN